MAEDTLLKWIEITSSDYYDLEDKNENALYFISDTSEIYKGINSFTEGVELLTGEFPLKGTVNKIYINKTTLEGKVYTGVDWITVMYPVSKTLAADNTTDNSLITGGGIKLYVSDALSDILSGAGITGNVIEIGKEFTVKGTTIGSYKDGDIIAKNYNIYDILRNILQAQVLPTYTDPSVSMSLQNSNNEAGATLSGTIDPLFIKNDAGPITRYVLSKRIEETTQVLIDSKTITPYIIPSSPLTDKSISYTAAIHHDAGPIKTDNLGVECSQGHILSGVVSKTLSIKSHRKCFYGSEAGPTTPCLECADIRSLPFKTEEELALGDNCISLECKPGDTRLTIAYPAYLPDVFYISSFRLGIIVTGIFEKSTIMVSGDNDYAPIEYKVYTYIPAIPFPSGDGYLVSIKKEG